MKKSNGLMAEIFNKWLLFSVFSLVIMSAAPKKLHPFHVSVVEINHNKTDKTLEITCKIFTDDFEKVLAQNYKTKVDLINPPDKAAMDTVVKMYVLSHFGLVADGVTRPIEYLGFERDQEAVYSYVQIVNVESVKKIAIFDKLMHDMFEDQVNIVHVVVNGKRQSRRLDYPNTSLEFQF